MFSTCSFYDKFTVLPNLELIGTISKTDPINPPTTTVDEPLGKTANEGLLLSFLHFGQRQGRERGVRL